jgi:hypothetical protein
MFPMIFMLFIDDVSANASKLWNKHYVCYISNTCLHHEHLDKEYSVCFMASSPNVSPLELIQGIREYLNIFFIYFCLLFQSYEV